MMDIKSAANTQVEHDSQRIRAKNDDNYFTTNQFLVDAMDQL